MKRLVLASLAFALFRTSAAAQGFDQSLLLGRWSGTGTFFKTELQREFGAIPFVLESSDDLSFTGRVGQATLHEVHFRKTRDGLEIRAKLKGAIVAHPALKKDHLMLIVTSLSDSTLQAEFHLKSNFAFDARMQEGHVALTRVR